MAAHYSANQFEQAYAGKRFGNWEIPKWYPSRPHQHKGTTKFTANDRGHLLDKSKKLGQNPWGNFLGTYQLPDKLTRKYANDYNKCLNSRGFGVSIKGLKCPTKCEASARLLAFDPHRNKSFGLDCSKKKPFDEEYMHKDYDPHKTFGLDFPKKEPSDPEYVPGDFTPYKAQHPSRKLLLEDKYRRDNNIETEYKLNKNLLGDHHCKPGECEPPPINFSPLLPKSKALVTSNLSPRIQDLDLVKSSSNYNKFTPNYDFDDKINDLKEPIKMPGSQTITRKPNERCPSPVVPAYANFELAKRMHQTNLDHQPLPDCVADLAFRKLQITGDNPGLALDIHPIATGMSVKTHNAGPTHCTKMRVYRPKTSGVVPRAYSNDNFRAYSANGFSDKKMGAMDLAIRWDYKPAQEPPIPRHIDGSNDSAGPAVFNYVKSPRDDPGLNTGRSAGVFTSTLGEPGFFDKDIMSRKTDFVGRKIDTDDFGGDLDLCRPMPRAHSVSRESSACRRMPVRRYEKQYQSTPDMLNDDAYKSLREKYLGPGCDFPTHTSEPSCKRVGFFKRARSRLCHKVAPEPDCHPRSCSERRMPCKAAFRAGVPRFNASGHFVSADSGCSMGSQRVLVVPRPRNPYSKRNYDIDTLVPPFKSYAGGAGEGGYPEHWRLASVYQHAYKPIQNRRKPLIQTVYK